MLLLGSLLVAPSGPAHARSSYLCTGYDGCKAAGYGHAGYKKHGSKMYWRMYAGHNCTNYAAYRMVRAGMPNTRPWSGEGNATHWGVAMRHITDRTPMVGSIAWWKAGNGVGSAGHVAYVERVVSATTIVISEDSWGGNFHWRTIVKDGAKGWPSGFIHFKDKAVVNKAVPTISGTPRVGVPLQVSTGTWTPAATLSYQWLADGVAIAGATGTTYTPLPSHAGRQLSVQVTAKALGYVTGSARTAPTATVAKGQLDPTSPPVVTGTPYVDETLTVSGAAWSPAPTRQAVQWLADGVPIPGATGTSLVLGQAQVDKVITARVTGTRAGYSAAAQESGPVGPVLAGVIEEVQPYAVRGGARVGATLAVAPGRVNPPDADVAYTWLRDGQPIAGQDGPTYTLTAADVGRRIGVRVEIRKQRYRSLTRVVRVRERVRTDSDVVLTARAGRGRAVIGIRVRATGVAAVGGLVTVKVAGQTHQVRVRDGRARLVLTRLAPGRRVVVARYSGTAVVARSKAAVAVVVQRR